VKERFFSDFKRFFLRGLAAVLPALLTVAILIYVIRFVNTYVGQYINISALYLVAMIWTRYEDYPEGEYWRAIDVKYSELFPAWDSYFWWVGFVLALIALYIFGRFVASFIGRSLWQLLEKALFRVPVVRQIYPSVKQVTDFLLTERSMDLSRVVAVEYPRKGVWSLGLVTGPGLKTLNAAAGSELLTVFVPSSPTPVTGYTITVRRDEVIDLPLNIDEAFRFTVSGGVLIPAGETLSEAETKQVRRGALPALKEKEKTE